MEKKNSLDIKKNEVKKDRGDQIKRVVKPKGILKKDVEITKDCVKDRGDSTLKIVKEKLNTLNFEKKSKDLVTDRVSEPKPNKYNLKNAKHDEAISIDKSFPRNTKQNEQKNLDKSAPVDVVTDRVDSVPKTLETKALKRKMFEKPVPIEFTPKNTKQNEVLNITSDKAPVGFVSDKGDTKTIKDIRVSVVKKNIVENEKHVNRLLDVDEKKRIREKYTFKLKAGRNKKVDIDSDLKDSQFEDNIDIPIKRNSVDNKDTSNDTAKSDSTKIDRASNSTEKSRKRPIIRTIVAKNDVTKVYKAVTFAEQKRKPNTPLQIKIPVSMKNMNTENNTLEVVPTKVPKLLQANDDALVRNTKNPNTLQSNGDNVLKNNKLAKIGNPQYSARNAKIPTDLEHCKIPKRLHNNRNNLRKNATLSQFIRSESRTSVKTKISKKGKRNRFKCKLTSDTLCEENSSPPTEVAKWAPSSINEHTQPYYEAWVNTTLAAISKNTRKDKIYYENRKLIKTFKRIMERSESSELVHPNYSDERYIGKIKIKHKQ